MAHHERFGDVTEQQRGSHAGAEKFHGNHLRGVCMTQSKKKILAFAGSLRADSFNKKLIQNAVKNCRE